MLSRLPLLLSAICTAFVFTHSLEASNPAENGLMVRLLACELAEDSQKVVLKTKSGASDVIALSSSGFTAPMAVAHREFTLWTPDQEAPLCEISLPATGTTFGILLVPQKQGGLTPMILRLDDDSFKPGDYFFVNCLQETLAITLGDTEVLVEEAKSIHSRPTGAIGGHFYPITMSIRKNSGDKVFASTRWPIQTNKRVYVIFTARDNGKPTYRAVDE